MVTPAWPQRLLGRIAQEGSAHRLVQAAEAALLASHIVRLGDLGFSAIGIEDRPPYGLVDGLDPGPNTKVDDDRDRPADPESA
jgi:hypothetical protein